jgi:ribosomal protein L35
MKQKTRKAVAKRVKITKGGKGKIMIDNANNHHLMKNKSKRSKRKGYVEAFAGRIKSLKRSLPFGK